MRKIDDQLLLKMAEEGKLQKEIAEHFRCTPAAICKRLKKLKAIMSVPVSFKKLSEKEKKFVIAKIEGKTQTQAALDSFECGSLDSAKSIGSQLMRKSDIQIAVAEIMQEEGLTRGYRVQRLKSHVDHVDPNVSLKALDQSWRLDGAYSPEKHIHAHHNIKEVVASMEVKKERLRILRRRHAKLQSELGYSDAEK